MVADEVGRSGLPWERLDYTYSDNWSSSGTQVYRMRHYVDHPFPGCDTAPLFQAKGCHVKIQADVEGTGNGHWSSFFAGDKWGSNSTLLLFFRHRATKWCC